MLTAHSLSIDRMTAEVVDALRGAGVPSLLLKGAVLARRLYADGASRPYVDCDLLVPSARLAEAEQMLHTLGFLPASEEEEADSPAWMQYSRNWVRPGAGACVELHWTLMNVGAGSEALWGAFTRGARRWRVGGVDVDVPGDPQLALHAALHVASDGAIGKPAEDLTRAVAQLPLPTWRSAAELARELDASRAFAAGLGLLAPGRELAGRLGLAPGGIEAFALDRLARESGWLATARTALQVVFPAPAYMRSLEVPLARRGRTGLLVAYALRAISVALRAPRALLVRRRESRGGPGGDAC